MRKIRQVAIMPVLPFMFAVFFVQEFFGIGRARKWYLWDWLGKGRFPR